MSGFIAFLLANPWRAATAVLGVALIVAGVGLKLERSGRQAAEAQVAALTEAVRTWEGVVAQRDAVIRQQADAAAKMQAEAEAAGQRARAAIAAVRKQVAAVQNEAERLRRQLAAATEALTCEAAVEEVRRGILP